MCILVQYRFTIMSDITFIHKSQIWFNVMHYFQIFQSLIVTTPIYITFTAITTFSIIIIIMSQLPFYQRSPRVQVEYIVGICTELPKLCHSPLEDHGILNSHLYIPASTTKVSLFILSESSRFMNCQDNTEFQAPLLTNRMSNRFYYP